MYALRVLASVGVAASLAVPAAAAAVSEQPAQWNWETGHRYYVDVEVQLPSYMWFVAEFNKQARAVAFQVRAVLDCEPGERETRTVREQWCTIDDIGLTAAGMKNERGLLQVILDEHDQRLTGSRLQLQVRDDGRIKNIDLEDLDRRNRRVGQMNENLRLVMTRVVAGLDLEMPASGPNETGQWLQRQNIAIQAPSALGSPGASEVAHRGLVRGDGTIGIRSVGRGVVHPSEVSSFEVGFEAVTVFDPDAGAIVWREWRAVGRPTASSATAEGTAGIPYVQRGNLRLLSPGEDADVGETLEVHPPGLTPPGALWPPIGEITKP